jgi:hypothetical protein
VQSSQKRFTLSKFLFQSFLVLCRIKKKGKTKSIAPQAEKEFFLFSVFVSTTKVFQEKRENSLLLFLQAHLSIEFR